MHTCICMSIIHVYVCVLYCISDVHGRRVAVLDIADADRSGTIEFSEFNVVFGQGIQVCNLCV